MSEDRAEYCTQRRHSWQSLFSDEEIEVMMEQKRRERAAYRVLDDRQVTRYQKKPVVIEAVQLCWRTWSDVCEFLGDIISETNSGRSVATYSEDCGESAPFIECTIPTLEGAHIARHGDYIIRGVKGEFYSCKPDVFRATYEETRLPRTGTIENKRTT